MPKENTHLKFAYDLKKKFKDENLKDLISKNREYFHLGSYFPDTFYYDLSVKRKFHYISEYIAGGQEDKTNEFVFYLLDRCKDDKDKVFIFGALTHFALDIIFHPIIYYFAGRGYQSNSKAARDLSQYRHWHLETYLDSIYNRGLTINKNTSFRYFKELRVMKEIAKKFHISKKDIFKYHKIQRIITILSRSWIVHVLIRLLSKIKIIPWKFLGITYSNLKHEKLKLEELIEYRDLFTGESKKATLEKLLKESDRLAIDLIETAHMYLENKITRAEAENVIDGKNLGTGVVGKKVKDIKFDYKSI